MLDYKLEEWLRSQKAPGCPECPKLTWQHRVQYAVSYAINDYFTLDPAVRLHTPIQVLLNRRWPRNRDDFPDPLHYWKVYNDIVGQLIRISGPEIYEHPIALYEKWDTQVAELDLHLSVIFQTVWQRSKDQKPWITVQKFLVEDHPELVRAFTHMTNVFWNSAFGEAPDQIEILPCWTTANIRLRRRSWILSNRWIMCICWRKPPGSGLFLLPKHKLFPNGL
ncbi:hypothetical protein [Paenibacillus macerans]|uniref:hypothetical protein n=1 Tax=Paenibacillus macerans TaxID=44252 RepID=UPI00203A4FD8|nr:hypothetical protein [Paenibacillus macerans]MCM3703109.1 hypothetical protein [Paenibacillus macerans]